MKALMLSIWLCVGFVGAAFGHETTRSFVTLTRAGFDVVANVQVPFRDVEVAFWIDEDLDGQITWGEASRKIGPVTEYVITSLTLDANGACLLTRTDASTSAFSGVPYLDLTFRGRCPDAETALTVTSGLFSEFDPEHRVFLTAIQGKETATHVLSADQNEAVLPAIGTAGTTIFQSYFAEGFRHQLLGVAHVVFVLLLILPVALTSTSLRQAALGVLIPVAGFGLAHALTLTAAATLIPRPPSAVIDTLIALSIAVFAVENLRPFIPAPRAVVATIFGLVHGFGFASALGILPLSGFGFATALAGFNLGIEAAQFGIVLLAIPALFALRKVAVLIQLVSLGAPAAGLLWIWLRALV